MGTKYTNKKSDLDETVKIVDLFCGAGGLSYGICDFSEKFETIGAIDHNKHAVKTFNKNHSSNNVAIERDLSSYSPESFSSERDIDPKDVDVICGGPPCKGFSSIRPERSDNTTDYRNYLYQFFFDYVDFFQPKVFVMENVPRILSHKDGNGTRIFESIIEECENIGYNFDSTLLNSAHYGVPQLRTRMILCGTSDHSSTIRFPKPEYKISEDVDLSHREEIPNSESKKPALTIESVIKDLPAISDDGTELDDDVEYVCEPKDLEDKEEQKYLRYLRRGNPDITKHITSSNGNLMTKRMTFAGDTKDDIPDCILPSSGYSTTYSRLYKNEPSVTLTGNFTTPSSTRCIHPYEHRALSIREGARIQSFPDQFGFCGPNTSVVEQIGNAVPPMLGKSVGLMISDIISEDF